MIKLNSGHIAQIANTLLRLATLVAKLGLTLYMGRYLSLAGMGTYGLAFGTSMITSVALGIRLDYAVSRELVGVSPEVALVKMRDQAVFYALNYAVLAVATAIIMAVGIPDVSTAAIAMIFAIAILESLGTMTYNNIISLGHPLLANILFFIRAGLWALVIAFVGFLVPSLRTAEAILVAWIIGVSASLIVTLWVWRDLPWRSLRKTPVDWVWIRISIKRCFFIWLGSLGVVGGMYTDRFIVAANLNLDLAGVVTFYASFTAALTTLIQSGVLAFSYPRLILLHRKNDRTGFWREAWKSGWHVAVSAGIIALGLGVCVPLIGRFLHHPILVEQAPTLWLMLFGVWMQANALTLHYILFARHQDRAIWLSGLLFLIPAFGGNALLVPMFGLIGIGYASVISNAFLLLWRLWCVRFGTEKRAVA